MYKLEDIIILIKELARRNKKPNLSYCQNLDYHIQNLGFKSRHHLKSYLSSDKIHSTFYTDLIKKICSARVPSSDFKYGMLKFEPGFSKYITHNGKFIDVHDIWIGLDANYYDVRVPSGDYDALRVVPMLRDEYNETVYVIESLIELKLWEKHLWEGEAVISFQLIKSYYPNFFKAKEKVIENYCEDRAGKIINVRSKIKIMLLQNNLTYDDI